MGSKPLQSSKNDTTVFTLWYEPLRCEKDALVEIRRDRRMPVVLLWCEPPRDLNRVPCWLWNTTGLCPAKPKKRTLVIILELHVFHTSLSKQIIYPTTCIRHLL